MVRAAYPLAREALGGGPALWTNEITYLLYYIGWETFFRGFLLFGLRERFGDSGANAVQSAISALIHASLTGVNKPFPETFIAIPAGYLLGWIALRTRSVWWGGALHAVVGVATDLAIVLRAIQQAPPGA